MRAFRCFCTEAAGNVSYQSLTSVLDHFKHLYYHSPLVYVLFLRLKIAMEGCFLECLQRSHDPIPLPDGIPVKLGRSPLTKITDPRCSRSQVEVTANWETQNILVKQLGTNITSVDGKDLHQGETVHMSPTSTLFVLKGIYPHRIHFRKSSPVAADDTTDKDKSADSKTVPNLSEKLKRAHPENNHKTGEHTPAKKQKLLDHKLDNEVKKEKETEKVSLGKTESLTRINGAETSYSKKVSEHFTSLKTKSPGPDEDGAQHKANSKSKRESTDNNGLPGKTKSVKRLQADSTDEDSQIEDVSRKLKELKESAKAKKLEKARDEEKQSSLNKSSSSLSKKKSSSEMSSKNKPKREGKPAKESEWVCHENKLYIFTSKGVKASDKIAGFDIDGTIITTQSGRVFAKDMTDWKVLMPEVFGKLKHLYAAGYKIAFFTNQLGVGRGKLLIEDLQNKFEKVVDKLQVPIQIFVSTSGGFYRKPAPGMWQMLKKQRNDGIPISLAESFFVGDAAGRPENWAPKKKKDFSCSDRLFAINAGLKFHTPEEFFLGQKPAPFNLPEFDPRSLNKDAPLVPLGEELISPEQEVVVFVGFQASGKSFFARHYLIPKGYVYVNQDTLKSWQRCVSECNKALANGSRVVIDNTNVDPESRARYIDCAKKAGKPCRCFFFDLSIAHCRHNERFREIIDSSHKPINEQIFHSTKNKFKEPELREGFSKILRINFVPKFENKLHEKIYRQFLLEK